ncbi:type II toxin-antitoxin system VapC family toxin [Endothiovibrio diazotrophicus]
MDRPPPRANCFDASALIKVFATESGSDIVRDFFYNRSPTKYATPFCFYESLSVLKVKWLYRKEMTKDEYTEAVFRLTAWYGSSTRYAKDIDLENPIVFSKVREIAGQYSLDISDAFQIISVKDGYFSHLIDDSQTVLVTADEYLAKAAKAEGVKSWYCLGDPEP